MVPERRGRPLDHHDETDLPSESDRADPSSPPTSATTRARVRANPTTARPPPRRPDRRPAAARRPRRLYRSRDDRVIGGVCGGIAEYFRIDPVIVRVVAVALVFAGGAGLLAYLAAVLLVPDEGEGGQPPRRPAAAWPSPAPCCSSSRSASVLPFHGGWGAAGALVPLGSPRPGGARRLAAGFRCSALGRRASVLRAGARRRAPRAAAASSRSARAWAAAAGGGGVVAGVVIVAGVALVAGAFLGGARWLILPALALALPAGVVAAADIDVTGGVGDRAYRPASGRRVRDSYRLGVGHLVVDLRDAS